MAKITPDWLPKPRILHQRQGNRFVNTRGESRVPEFRSHPEGGKSVRFGIGQPVPRKEDPRFLTGRGRFIADIDLPRQAFAVFLFSPHAHARITSIDTAAAAAPGVY